MALEKMRLNSSMVGLKIKCLYMKGKEKMKNEIYLVVEKDRHNTYYHIFDNEDYCEAFIELMSRECQFSEAKEAACIRKWRDTKGLFSYMSEEEIDDHDVPSVFMPEEHYDYAGSTSEFLKLTNGKTILKEVEIWT